MKGEWGEERRGRLGGEEIEGERRREGEERKGGQRRK